MHFITDQQDDTTIFRLLEERLDSRNAGQLKAEFLILAQPNIQNLIVDLTEVRHIDSAGLSALLLAQRQMSLHEGELRLAGVTDQVRSLLEMTQLDRVFQIFNTVDEALEGIEPEAVLEEIGIGSLGSDAPGARAVRLGAIAAGGSLGAAALADILLAAPFEDDLDTSGFLALGDEEDGDDDLDETFDDDDDLDDDDDDLDEEDDVEEEEEKVEPEDIVEPDDLEDEFEDDDWDDEELDDDDEDDDY
jgi:anti-sigma B factor antagonist